MSIYLSLKHEGHVLHFVGILANGSLHNPNHYPEALVRAAVAAADARRHEKRSKAAKRGAVTRANRVERKVQQAALESSLGPRESCFVCGKRLMDAESVQRGVGPECWQAVDRLRRYRAHD